jgi:hypothetical protein
MFAGGDAENCRKNQWRWFELQEIRKVKPNRGKKSKERSKKGEM